MEKQPLRLFRVGTMLTSRIEAFSDGVFAFVVTLLIVELHVPAVQGSPDVSAALIKGLIALAPKFLSYALSFTIICIWWVAHYHFFHILTRSDRGLLWLNSLFLLWLVFIPFPTAMLGDYPNNRVAVMLYGIVTMITGICFASMRYYAFYVAGLVDPRIDPDLLKHAMRRSCLNPVLHLIAVLLAFIDPRISIGCYVFMTCLFFIPGRLERYELPSDQSEGG